MPRRAAALCLLGLATVGQAAARDRPPKVDYTKISQCSAPCARDSLSCQRNCNGAGHCLSHCQTRAADCAAKCNAAMPEPPDPPPPAKREPATKVPEKRPRGHSKAG